MKTKRKLLAWSIGSGLLISSALYSGVSLAYVNRINQNNQIDSQDSKNNIKITEPLNFNKNNLQVIPLVESKGAYDLPSDSILKEDVFISNIPNVSVLYIPNDLLKIEKIRLTKNGDTTSLFQSNTTGLNSAILVKENGILDAYRSTIKTNGKGAKGIYISGAKTKGMLENVIVETNNNDSTGIESADNSKILSANVAINTNGEHSIGIASSNKGTLINNKGYIYTTGKSSPGFYSAGNMVIENTDVESLLSPVGILEGSNNIVLKNNNLKGKEGIKILNILSDKGKSIMNITEGYLSIKHGYTFDIDNISTLINIEKVKINNPTNKLIKMSSTSPKTAEINIKNQYIEGDIENDINSKIILSMNNGSLFEGCIKNGASICFDRTSKWNVKSNSYVGAISIPDDDIENINRYIKTNGYKVKYEIESNSWLKGKKIKLKDGGYLIPS